MRITDFQRKQFVNCITKLNLKKFELHLFGSRSSSFTKGGDIDLLLLVQNEDLESVLEKKFQLVTEMKLATQDEKIDLTISTFDKLHTDVFLKSIADSLILLS